MNGIKLAVFDLDGTLLNTLDDLTESVNYALKMLNLPLKTRDEVRLMIGNGVEKLMTRALPACALIRLEKAVELQKKFYLEHAFLNTRPYKGVNELFTALKNSGVKTGVFSNKDAAATELLCERFFNGKIDYVFGTGSREAKKPDPWGLREIMKRAGAKNSETVFVGDSDVDIMTAANGGVKCISVCWGYRDEKFLQKSGALILANKPSEVYSAIMSL